MVAAQYRRTYCELQFAGLCAILHDLNRRFCHIFTELNRRFQHTETQHWIRVFIKRAHDFFKPGHQAFIGELEGWEDIIGVLFKRNELILFYSDIYCLAGDAQLIGHVVNLKGAAKLLEALVKSLQIFAAKAGAVWKTENILR